MSRKSARERFREGVFERDGGRCVVCGAAGADAHHVIERRLFPDGGYELDNGATLCPDCHLQAEQTTLSCDEVRQGAGIERVVLPPHLDADERYDKWGNVVLANGRRLPGELFDDESIHKVLAAGGVLGRFTWKVKYPRTYHLPWSGSTTADDRILDSVEHLRGIEVVVTEKMDGENVTMGRAGLYARSTEWRRHPARSWVSNFHARIAHQIPEGWRICGENLYARHTVAYEALPSYFLGFSVWEGLRCLPWAETLEWFQLLGITPVPTIWRGEFDERAIRGLDTLVVEGYVVRPAGGFRLAEFRSVVAKYLRPGFVDQRPHWQLGRRLVENRLAEINPHP